MTLASRTFDAAGQMLFAKVSGDHNPMHLDSLLARRTQAGAPVVHGIHLLLWALDALAASDSNLLPMRSLRVQFDRFVYLGVTVDAVLAQRAPNAARLNVCADGMPVTKITIEFGDAKLAAVERSSPSDLLSPRQMPLELDFEQLAGRAGGLVFATPPGALAAMFPAASAWIGARRLAALAATSNLVGMFCPGLHSIFSSLTVDASAERDPEEGLAFRVTDTDARFRLVRLAVSGGGLTGSLTSFARTPPTAQASMQSLSGSVGPTEFAGSVALIVGGSRGLGELTAKLAAAGGGRVILTYRVGRVDAENVVQEIRAAGGACEAMPFDASAPVEAQLAALIDAPTHLYYFATPSIFRPQPAMFDKPRLDQFLDVYVDGFWRLAQTLRARRPALSIFYPSSVAVAERPKGMTEYAMAKAAGETLCADMNRALAPLNVTVSRLPRLATDQTASLQTVETASALETMLPIIREVQSWPR